jgi:hypothetical protein
MVTQVAVRAPAPPVAAPPRPAPTPAPVPVAAPAPPPITDNAPGATRSALGMARRPVAQPAVDQPNGGGAN